MLGVFASCCAARIVPVYENGHETHDSYDLEDEPGVPAASSTDVDDGVVRLAGTSAGLAIHPLLD